MTWSRSRANLLKSINFVSSTSEAMRLIKAGGVKIDGEKISDTKKIYISKMNNL